MKRRNPMNENCNYREKLASLIDKWITGTDKFEKIQKDSEDALKDLRQILKNTGTAFELRFV